MGYDAVSDALLRHMPWICTGLDANCKSLELRVKELTQQLQLVENERNRIQHDSERFSHDSVSLLEAKNKLEREVSRYEAQVEGLSRQLLDKEEVSVNMRHIYGCFLLDLKTNLSFSERRLTPRQYPCCILSRKVVTC